MTSLSWGGRVVGQVEAEVHGKERSNRDALLGQGEESEGRMRLLMKDESLAWMMLSNMSVRGRLELAQPELQEATTLWQAQVGVRLSSDRGFLPAMSQPEELVQGMAACEASKVFAPHV